MTESMAPEVSASAAERSAPSAPGAPGPRSDRRLRGRLGVWAVVFLVLAAASPLGVMGGTVPIGISVGNGVAFPIAFIAGLLILLVFAVGYTTLTKYVRNAGAFYSYIAKGLGTKTGLGAAFLATVAYTAETIAVYGLLAGGAVSLFDSWGVHIPWGVFAVASVLIVGILGYFHINITATVCAIFMMGEVLIILALDIAVFLHGGGPEGFSTGFAKPSSIMSGAPGLALLFAFLSYLGVDATAVYRNESRDPDRTIPRATYLAVILIGAFYIASTWALISAWGDSKAVQVAGSNPVGMVPDAVRRYLGGAAEQIVQVLFVTSLFICVLAFHNIVSRYLFTLSNRAALPERLGRAHGKHGSPHITSSIVSIVSIAGVIIALALRLDPVNDLYTWLAGTCTVGFILLLMGTAASSIPFFLRQRRLGTLNENSWHAFLAPAISVVLLIGVFVLVLINLKSLVGDSLSAAITVLAVLAIACVGGVLVGYLRPTISLDVDEDEGEMEPAT